METITTIHQGKEPPRTHYIPEWAAKIGVKQKDIVLALGIDKSVVNKWFNERRLPRPDTLVKLAEMFGFEGNDVSPFFRHPDDDWIAVFFRNRSRDELERMKKMLEAAFPIDRQAHRGGA